MAAFSQAYPQLGSRGDWEMWYYTLQATTPGFIWSRIDPLQSPRTALLPLPRKPLSCDFHGAPASPVDTPLLQRKDFLLALRVYEIDYQEWMDQEHALQKVREFIVRTVPQIHWAKWNTIGDVASTLTDIAGQFLPSQAETCAKLLRTWSELINPGNNGAFSWASLWKHTYTAMKELEMSETISPLPHQHFLRSVQSFSPDFGGHHAHVAFHPDKDIYSRLVEFEALVDEYTYYLGTIELNAKQGMMGPMSPSMESGVYPPIPLNVGNGMAQFSRLNPSFNHTQLNPKSNPFVPVGAAPSFSPAPNDPQTCESLKAQETIEENRSDQVKSINETKPTSFVISLQEAKTPVRPPTPESIGDNSSQEDDSSDHSWTKKDTDEPAGESTTFAADPEPVTFGFVPDVGEEKSTCRSEKGGNGSNSDVRTHPYKAHEFSSSDLLGLEKGLPDGPRDFKPSREKRNYLISDDNPHVSSSRVNPRSTYVDRASTGFKPSSSVVSSQTDGYLSTRDANIPPRTAWKSNTGSFQDSGYEASSSKLSTSSRANSKVPSVSQSSHNTPLGVGSFVPDTVEDWVPGALIDESNGDELDVNEKNTEPETHDDDISPPSADYDNIEPEANVERNDQPWQDNRDAKVASIPNEYEDPPQDDDYNSGSRGFVPDTGEDDYNPQRASASSRSLANSYRPSKLDHPPMRQQSHVPPGPSSEASSRWDDFDDRKPFRGGNGPAYGYTNAQSPSSPPRAPRHLSGAGLRSKRPSNGGGVISAASQQEVGEACPCGLRHRFQECFYLNKYLPNPPMSQLNPSGRSRVEAIVRRDRGLARRIDSALFLWRQKRERERRPIGGDNGLDVVEVRGDSGAGGPDSSYGGRQRRRDRERSSPPPQFVRMSDPHPSDEFIRTNGYSEVRY